MSKILPLLVELRTEELPPGLLDGLARDFAAALHEQLVRERFCQGLTSETSMDSPINPTPLSEVAANSTELGRRHFATPRRLVALIEAVKDQSPGQVNNRRGPSIDAAYDDTGKPTKALLGFLRSAGVQEQDVETIEHKGRQYVSVVQCTEGQDLEAVVGKAIQRAISSIVAPRMMRWGSGETRFVRPLHGVLAVHSDRTMVSKVFGKDSATETVGHRFLSKGPVSITSANDYFSVMANNKVMVDTKDRVDAITAQATELDSGVDMNQGLLDQIAAMCEWPSCYLCNFEQKYLKLPSLAVISCMEKHLRCFPIFEGDDLTSRFVYVADNEPHSREKLVTGVERVMRARLDDALYIYEIDLLLSEGDLLGKLDRIAYVRGFGSLRDHCDRVVKLALEVGGMLGLDKDQAEVVASASRLHKADLGTLMVDEHPDLAGYMAAVYLSGESEKTRDLIRHLPDRELDGDQGDIARDCLVLASEAERLTGIGKLAGLSSGSSDPMGLRRCMMRIIRVLARHPGVDLGVILSVAYDRLADHATAGEVDKGLAESFGDDDKEPFIRRIKWMALRRLALHSADLLGLEQAPDSRATQAVLGLWADTLEGDDHKGAALPFDVAEIRQRLLALDKFMGQRPRAYEDLISASKRLFNMASHYQGEGETSKAGELSKEGSALLGRCRTLEEDGVLANHFTNNSLRAIKDRWNTELMPGKTLSIDGSGSKDYEESLSVLADMRTDVDAFFDNVRVLDDKKDGKHKLALVKLVEVLFETLVCKSSSLYRGADWLAADDSTQAREVHNQ